MARHADGDKPTDDSQTDHANANENIDNANANDNDNANDNVYDNDNNANDDCDSVARALLAAVQQTTGHHHLRWARPPRRLSGGYWAEMFEISFDRAPPQLAGTLVARIMPDPFTAAHETALQRHLAAVRFAVPAVRAAGAPSDELDRAWMLMDCVAGQPMLAGLSGIGALVRAPGLVRRLPRLLAEAAASLHACPPGSLADDLSRVARHADVTDFIARLGEHAGAAGRPDLAALATQLAATAPPDRVICHGDVHPFNLLVGDGGRWTLIDWSTAVLADRHYDVAFTSLMLANPPLGGPRPVRTAAHAAGRWMSKQFVAEYTSRSGRAIDSESLAWGRRVHALRAVVEVAVWDAAGTRSAHAGHPWLTMLPVLEAALR